MNGPSSELTYNKLLTYGLSWGNPRSVYTYCGIPYLVFRELRKRRCLAGTSNSQQTDLFDLFGGAVDWKRSFASGSIKRSALWQYYPETIEMLTQKFSRKIFRCLDFNILFQFGVAVIPPPGTVHLAHLEMSVETAFTEKHYARSHGFNKFSDLELQRAVEGEKIFLERCSLIWTNSEWTAEGFLKQGFPKERIRIFAPASGISDPGEITRDWEKCNLLFIGVDWQRKGGDLLLEAFKIVKREKPKATLTIIGCNPVIRESGVRVLGYLRKNRLTEARIFRQALEEATLYCMPTRWDSTGIPFMEGALYGLPVVMSSGQGREKIFPKSMSVQIEDPEAEGLAAVILDLFKDPGRMQAMGQAGRKHILDNYTWDIGVRKIISYLDEARNYQS